MTILGKPQGIFDLYDSDHSVGSYLKKQDILEILQVTSQDLSPIKFKIVNGVEVVDERVIQKSWYSRLPTA